MRSLVTFLILTVASASVAQDATARLRAELERIHDLDQNDRHHASGFIGAQKDSVLAHMVLYDSLNLVRVTAILDSAGWLGVDVLGHKANQALFLVLQHADAQPKLQEAYLPMMREAVEQDHARASELAMFEDRVAVNNGRLQIYGSQIGWRDGKGFVKPLVDEEHVNERRAAVGLEPLERYTERFGFTWAPTPKQERVLLMGPVKH